MLLPDGKCELQYLDEKTNTVSCLIDKKNVVSLSISYIISNQIPLEEGGNVANGGSKLIKRLIRKRKGKRSYKKKKCGKTKKSRRFRKSVRRRR
jgi:hypothetical protein